MTHSFFVANIIAFLAISLSSMAACFAGMADGYEAADSIVQEWQITHQDSRLKATGTVTVTGKPGDRFLLVKAPGLDWHGDKLHVACWKILNQRIVK